MKDWLSRREIKIVIVDLLMMAILTINLLLIVFDFIFSSVYVQQFFQTYLPAFHDWYDINIHKNFFTIDLYFVAIYVVELTIRWIIAIRRQTYHRWFFYPFARWYDVLGCIPIGSFRALRILRVISIVVRLQRLEIVDITRTYIYKKLSKYADILVEEITDRVVVNIIDGMQEEVRSGGQVTDNIVERVVRPQKEALVEWLSHRVQKVSEHNYAGYRDEIRDYVNTRIKKAVDENQEIQTIHQIPVVGTALSGKLEHAISDIVFNVINGSMADLASSKNKVLVDELTDIVFEAVLLQEEDSKLNDIVVHTIVESLEIVKDQVKVKQWKLREMEKEEFARE